MCLDFMFYNSGFRFQVLDARFSISSFRIQISRFICQIAEFNFQSLVFIFQISELKLRCGLLLGLLFSSLEDKLAFRILDCGLQIASCIFQVFRFHVLDFKLSGFSCHVVYSIFQISDFRSQITIFGFPILAFKCQI